MRQNRNTFKSKIEMNPNFGWLFMLVYTRACVIEDPIIDSDAISKRGLQRVGNIFYLLANTRPTLSCEANLTSFGDDFRSTVNLQWFHNGGLQNASHSDFTAKSRVRIFYGSDAGSSFVRRELKCVLNVSSDCVKESTVFLQVAKPVSEVNAFFGPNRTRTLSARVGTQFDLFCSADGVPEPTFMWHSMYPGSTLWNEVGFSRNLTEYVVEEELPGPTLYRCQAVNLANRDTSIIASPVLELTPIESDVEIEPTWVVTVKPTGKLSVQNAGDDDKFLAKVTVLVATVVVAILLLLGFILYIKYRRWRLERTDSGHKQESLAMKPYRAEIPSKPPRNRPSDIDSSTYSIEPYDDSYTEVIQDPEKDEDHLYLTPKSSPKFLPLPNIPGRIPSSASRNSLTNSDVKDDADEVSDDEDHIYNEIPLYVNEPSEICISKQVPIE